MSATQQELLNAVFRWLHVVAGVVWLGHLYFFNLVHTHVARQWTAEAKQTVAPLLLPRTHFWMRWGALVTVVSGLLLLGVVYQAGSLMVDHDTTQTVELASAASFAALIVPFFIYDVIWRSKLGQRTAAAGVISFALLAAAIFALAVFMSGRALYVHAGALLAMVMAMNVWMRIWPAQRKALEELKRSPELTVAATQATALVSLRSRHNIYLSVPATFFMVSNHFPSLYTTSAGPLYAVLAVALGFGLANVILRKSESEALTSF